MIIEDSLSLTRIDDCPVGVTVQQPPVQVVRLLTYRYTYIHR